jgi:hypothetical protein
MYADVVYTRSRRRRESNLNNLSRTTIKLRNKLPLPLLLLPPSLKIQRNAHEKRKHPRRQKSLPQL